MIGTIEVFVESLSSLMAVFTDYDGGEFCSGVIFGQTGAQMLTNIAKTLMQIQQMGNTPAGGNLAIGAGKYGSNNTSHGNSRSYNSGWGASNNS